MANERLIGVIGGSGLYEIEGIKDVTEKKIKTPFGNPSDSIMIGTLNDRRVAFLPRHGRGHRILPAEVNSRANIWVLKKLGVEWIISVSAVGSMKEEIKPRDFVIPDQLFDRTKSRISTFFGDGIVVHIGFAQPYCKELREILYKVCKENNITTHYNGTYVCIDGPSFSTKAESRIYRSWGVDVIGMTNLPEAKLAREAEICFATIALATDYDVWKEGEEVSVERVIANLLSNVDNVKKVIKDVVKYIPIDKERTCECSKALQNAIMTGQKLFPAKKYNQVKLLIKKYCRKGVRR
ncbi:MAG: S-methyl-5'-thioadenosine phosphorylase [Candidatus Hydrogenedentota bacterium]